MARNDYDKLSNEIIKYGYIVVVLDHNPGDMIKTDATKFRNGALYVKSHLVSWLSSTGVFKIFHWVMGGIRLVDRRL